MKKFLQKKLKDQKGMTLIELLAVIVIIAIIAAIAIPAIGNLIENSRHNAARADVQMVLSAANLYFTETGAAENDTVTLANLGEYIDDPGDVDSATITKLSSGNTISASVIGDEGTYTFPALTNAALSELTTEQIKGYLPAQ
ncbi:prepilin-type N-terminal cleavage/methylation domain-containing protein [Planococcus sp. SSTMD024]|uniref:prepilin-type N-terminal cleavage/methylation domain-containing protein n=1 Tax=Planococcus sp. SSTMD024 TaxID=3242163 RepID=UPI00351E8068